MHSKRYDRKRRIIGFFIVTLTLMTLLLIEAAPVWAGPNSAGLAVQYYTNVYIRNISRFPRSSGQSGAPIPQINHQFGNGQVFGSGAGRGVCVRMTGFINLSMPGRYEFQALSNDGIEVHIEGRRVLVDPNVHADRLSPTGTVNVTSPGWKPLEIKYFQRKGTAALKLYWKTPGASSMTIIPAAAYGH